MRKNPILMGQFKSEGCINTFIDKTWKVPKGDLAIEKGDNVGILYLCNGNANLYIDLAFVGAYITLWNHRLGHMSEKGMQILQSKKLLPSLKQVDLKFCELCIYGKLESEISHSSERKEA